VFPAATRSLLAAAGAAGARLVFADDTWMYGRVDGPMREDMPSNPVAEKAVLRAWLAEMVLAAHARGDVEVVIGRAPELWGPHVESLLAGWIFGAATKGRTARWPGDPDLPVTACYIEDFGRALVELATAADAAGRVWHVPVPPAITGRLFVEKVFAAVGRPAKVGRITPAGTVTEFDDTNPGAKPGAITAGPDGRIWFANYDMFSSLGSIWRAPTAITASSQLTRFKFAPLQEIDGLAPGAGVVWYTTTDNSTGGSAIGKIATS
jgi:hypothetical protein